MGAGGGACTAAGSGNISDTVNLPTGGSVTYTASASISAAAAGALSNTATVAAPDGVTDPNPGNTSATDSDTFIPSVDVSINQASGQADPTTTSPISFTVVFASLVNDFDDASDVTLSGTAGATSVAITEIAPMNGTTYNVAVSGMNSSGTVIATIAAGVATDSQGHPNAASTSTDNSVRFSPNFPVMSGIVCAGASPTNAATVAFNITFSTAITGVDTGDFALATTSVTGASIAGVTGSGAGSLSTANITTGGGTAYTFTVVFDDNQALDSASLDGSDIRVTGPGGFNQPAALVGMSPAGNGAPRTATYRISAPGGTWDSADNGTYSVALQANQVRDTAGNFAAGGTLGIFNVNISTTRYTVFLPLVARS